MLNQQKSFLNELLKAIIVTFLETTFKQLFLDKIESR